MSRKKKKPSWWERSCDATKPVREFLFDAFLEFIELMPMPFETPHMHLRRISGWPKEYRKSRINQELRRMKDRGWIEEAERQGKKFLKLTAKGKVEGLCRKIQSIRKVARREWDGKWRLALFDIPEKGRWQRDTIRWTLKCAGFQQLQKSVYVYPHEIPAEVIEYLKAAGLLSFIRFARIDKIDDEKDLQKVFKVSRR